MKLITLLESLGLSTKDARARFANSQIKVNGTVQTALDTNLKLTSETEIGYTSLDDFIFDLYMKSADTSITDSVMKYRATLTDLSTIFNIKDNTKLSEFLSGFFCLSISKNEHFVFMK